MSTYTQNDLLRIARRVNNAKRNYLLVNPLQGKHIPVSPTKSLEMMNALGHLLAEKYPETRLVVGFAETATAIGAVVASCFSDDCIYITTTREDSPSVSQWVLFSEEHSHAVEQKLCADYLGECISNADCVVFVDDEISTGKTLRNMIGQLRELYPQLAFKHLVAASILNRVSEENIDRLQQDGIICEYLLKVTDDHASQIADTFLVTESAATTAAEPLTLSSRTLGCSSLPNPRLGVDIKNYQAECQTLAMKFWEQVCATLNGLSNIVVLGTEECMYPALTLGRLLEEQGFAVRCHATTRSPIGICSDNGYPIVTGCKLPSFYEGGRNTYLYNLAHCDALVVVSDAPVFRKAALEHLAATWKPYGVQKLVFLSSDGTVWSADINSVREAASND